MDLATGAHVRIRVAPAGTRADQLAWNHWCAIVANLRHPLIAPLVDYGMADAKRTFEAYAIASPLAAGGVTGGRLLAHAASFLRAHGVDLPRPLADYLLRPVVRGGGAMGRLMGVRLQPRPVLEILREALDADAPPGPCAIEVTGEPQSGLRTLRLAAARTARLAGYIPVSAALLPDAGPLGAALASRHVCILADRGADRREPVARTLLHLGSASSRRHVLFAFNRSAPPRPAVAIDRMDAAALTRMVYLEDDNLPTLEELSDAARHAGGWPGLFLARLEGRAGRPGGAGRAGGSTAMVVHEMSPAYEVSPSAATPARPVPGTAPRPPSGILRRAPERARGLARAGRHAAAARLLDRAQRVLSARRDHEEAARCAVEIGWLRLERAQVAAAAASFDVARQVAPSGVWGIRAGIGLGVARSDDGRLVEAEAILRAAAAAAESLDDGVLAEQAAAALARCLFWQGRYGEAGATLRKAEAHAAGGLSGWGLRTLARILMAEQSVAAAVAAARRALTRAGECGDPQPRASALRVLAQAAAAGGDPASAAQYLREGLEAATAAHLPLEALRLRLAGLEIAAAGAPSKDSLRLAARLAAASYRCPPLLRFYARAVRARVESIALDAQTRTFVETSGAVAIAHAACAGGSNPVGDLEALLHIGQTATDDGTAIDRMADHLRARLRAATLLVTGPDPDRRPLAISGDAWRGEPLAAWRVLASGLSVALDPRTEPCQAAEPLRYSGDTIGSLAARWSAGTTTDPARAGALLRVGALAMSAHVRGVLDREVPAPASHPAAEIIGDSSPARTMRDAIARAARAPFPVLIEGESGSGKELVARAIHRLGPRRDRRFCAINCAALTDDLLEAELFGHARGAFTGAVSERAGLFEEADGGTLFLDEIGELSARAQAKLLRVLQDGQVRRVGENSSRRVDVRIVAATNRRLSEEAAAGRFRADLRFRLDVVRIEVPPLRDRAADVPMLAASFWNDASARMGSRATLAPETLTALSRYEWPGNVRELQNVIAWMAVHSPARGRISATAVPAHVAQAAVRSGGSFEEARAEFERRFVKAALATAGGHRARAAAALGISRQGLAKMLRRLSLEGDCR